MLSAALAPAAIIIACSQQLPGPRVCSPSQPCTAGNTCVLGRCRLDGTQPLSLAATRLVFRPQRMALIGDDQVRHSSELGSAFEFGERGREQQLLLAFAVSLPAESRVQRALLTFEPLPSCPHAVNDLSITLRRIVGTWQPHTLRSNSPPRMDLPMPFANEHVQGGPLRLDVTELVRGWASGQSRDRGIALSVAGQGSRANCYSTGLDYGAGPRLQVFLWPEEDPDAGADADATSAADGDAGEGGGAPDDDDDDEVVKMEGLR